MPVHHIHMKHRRTATFYRADPIPQAGEVRSEDGRGNFNGISDNFSADILPDSLFCLHLVSETGTGFDAQCRRRSPRCIKRDAAETLRQPPCYISAMGVSRPRKWTLRGVGG